MGNEHSGFNKSRNNNNNYQRTFSRESSFGMGSRNSSNTHDGTSSSWSVPMGGGESVNVSSRTRTSTVRPPPPALRGNPVVFLEFSVRSNKGGGQPEVIGRVEFTLRADLCPQTCENFRQLCVGHPKGHYRGCPVHRIVKDFVLQAGDITKGNGTGGRAVVTESGKLPDENFLLKHDTPYVLSMANAGPNTATSQFFVTLGSFPHLDKAHVRFSDPVRDPDMINVINIVQSYADQSAGARFGKPTADIFISDCGEVPLACASRPTAAPAAAAASASAGATAGASSNGPVRCFVDFAEDNTGRVLGRVVFELFNDKCPISSENFRALCTGEKRNVNDKLTYMGTGVHRLFRPSFCVQFGDNEGRGGFGGHSIYEGGAFADEESALRMPHLHGSLCMAVGDGPKRCRSQVYVVTAEGGAPHLDGKDGGPGSDAVFGRVITGMDVLLQMERVAGTASGAPRRNFHVADCGEVALSRPSPPASVGRQESDTSNSAARRQQQQQAQNLNDDADYSSSLPDPDAIVLPPVVRVFKDNQLPPEVMALSHQLLQALECSVCLSTFDSYSRMPHTLSCGHTVCLAHVPLLKSCPVCRARIVSDRNHPPAPNFVLRDLCALLAPTDGQSIADSKQPAPRASTPPPSSMFADPAALPRTGSDDLGAGFDIFDEPQVVVAPPSSRRARRRGASPPPVARTRGLQRELPRPAAATGAAAAAASSASAHVCPHDCSISRTQRRCCLCCDSRPLQEEGTYSIYVDGAGYQNSGYRWIHYCPACRGAQQRLFDLRGGRARK